MEHHGGESSTWLKGRYIQDDPFHIPHQRNARAECQTTAATLEMLRGGAENRLRWRSKHLSHLVFTPPLNTQQLLLLVAFHMHAVSPGLSTRVSQTVRSEGNQNKTLLCICQAVPTDLTSQRLSGHIRTRGGALLKQGHGVNEAASSFEIPQKSEGRQQTIKKWDWGCHPGAVERLVPMERWPEIRQSARALISSFYVLKGLHLHSHVCSCSQRFFLVIKKRQNRLDVLQNIKKCSENSKKVFNAPHLYTLPRSTLMWCVRREALTSMPAPRNCNNYQS